LQLGRAPKLHVGMIAASGTFVDDDRS